jgi:hypothetical protein
VRTTLTLDRDVAEYLKKEMRRTGRDLKALVNDALRRGLIAAGKPPRPRRFAVHPHAFGVKSGVDLDRMNRSSRRSKPRSASENFGGDPDPDHCHRGVPRHADRRSVNPLA